MLYPVNEVFETIQGEGYFLACPLFLLGSKVAPLAVAGVIPSILGRCSKITKLLAKRSFKLMAP